MKASGKLKFTYETITNLEAKIKELEEQIKQLSTPNIYWLEEDHENGTDNIDCLLDFVDYGSVGQTFIIDLATRLQSIKIKITGFDEDNNIEYNIIS